MAAVLLVLFPFLLMVHTRAAWAALATAIVLLGRRAFGSPQRTSRRTAPAEYDASI